MADCGRIEIQYVKRPWTDEQRRLIVPTTAAMLRVVQRTDPQAWAEFMDILQTFKEMR